jgi:hypothetical protein
MLPLPPQINDPLGILSPISPEAILETLKLQRNSAPGPDGIPWPVLKKCPQFIFTRLANLYNAVLHSGYYPSNWKQANITYIPKPNKDSQNPLNYRPISLLNTIGKLFEKIVTSRLRLATNASKVIPPTQFGFVPGLSCQNPLINLTSAVSHAFNQHKTSVALLIDIEKAYDKVWHQALIYKMATTGLPIPLVRLIYNYLQNRTACSRYKSIPSLPFHLAAGVPQGAPLSCDLFNISISDLPQPHSTRPGVTLHTQNLADDTLLLSIGKDPHSVQTELQRYIDTRLQPWLNTWRIKTNPNKSQVINFYHPNLSRTCKFYPTIVMYNQHIQPVDAVTYLGIKFSRTLHWEPHLRSIRTKIKRRTNLLKLLRHKGKGTNLKTLLHLIKTYIRPVLEYGNIVTTCSPGSVTQHRVHTLERGLIRRALDMHPLHPSDMLYQDLNFEPIRNRLPVLWARFFYRQLLLPDQPIMQIFKHIVTTNRKPPKRSFTPMAHVLTYMLKHYLPENNLQALLTANLIPPALQQQLDKQLTIRPIWLPK